MNRAGALLKKMAGGLLTVLGALIVAAGAFSFCAAATNNSSGTALILACGVTAVGFFLFWGGNRLQGLDSFGKHPSEP